MTATAEAYGFGARAPYAQMRESEYDMKERVRLSGLFPRVRNEPMSVQLKALLKEFENNAALTGILERRRRQEERLQYELQGQEGMDAMNRNLAPQFRTGLAGAATSAAVATALAEHREKVQKQQQRAADVLAAGNNQPGEMSVDDAFGLASVPTPGSRAPTTPAQMPGTPGQMPGTPVPGTPGRMPGTPGRMPGTPAQVPGTPGGRRRRQAPVTPSNRRSLSRGASRTTSLASGRSGYSPTEAMSDVG